VGRQCWGLCKDSGVEAGWPCGSANAGEEVRVMYRVVDEWVRSGELQTDVGETVRGEIGCQLKGAEAVTSIYVRVPSHSARTSAFLSPFPLPYPELADR